MLRASSLLVLALPCALASGTFSLFSSDLTGKPSLANVKGEYNSNLDIAGRKAKLSVLYDMASKKNFFKEAKLAGAVSDIKYTLSHAIGGATGLTLTSVQRGVNLKAVANSKDMLTSVSAKGSAGVAGVDISYEPAYLIKKKLSELTLSTSVGLGAGFKASGSVTATSARAVDTEVELGYGASLGEGRSLSATVLPVEQTASVEVVDKTTEPGATWIATAGLAMDSKPILKLKRAISF